MNEKDICPDVEMKKYSKWLDTNVGMLPFMMFGIASIFTAIFPYQFRNVYVAFYLIALVGLIFGLIKGVPRWTYTYLGWSMVMAWWWMAMPVVTLRGGFGSGFQNQLLGWMSWLPLLFAFGLVVILCRSLSPLQKLLKGVWRDWSYLSLMMYTFVAFTQLIYDENHHPYLIAFMIGSTIFICIGAWLFLQSATVWQRALSLVAGFVLASVIGSISYATWDWATYYGFPPTTPEPWYIAALKAFLISPIWIVVLFWPILIGLVHRIFDDRKMV